jgi:hypothetical protein
MIFLKFIVASFAIGALSIFFVNIADAYLSGPNSHVLEGIVAISKVIVFAIMETLSIIVFKFYKEKFIVLLAFIALLCFSFFVSVSIVF